MAVRKKMRKGQSRVRVTKKSLSDARKARKLVKASGLRHFKDTGELTAGSLFYCITVGKHHTVSTCALGLCGQQGKKCPFFRNEDDQKLLIKYWDERNGQPDWYKAVCKVVTEADGTKSLKFGGKK